MPQYTDRLLKPSAACPEIPFYHEFSCREREMKILLACLRRTLLSRDLSGEDHEILASLGGPGRDGEDHGSTPLLLIRGKSGMGKSRLIEEARSVARESGIRVKEIFCYERQGVPFLPILRLVKELILESPSEEQLWKKYSYVLSRVYPELASQLGEGEAWVELPAPDGKTQFFDALTGLLGELSRERPLLLVIHDLHRCDQGTVDFLEFLGRNAFLDDACQVRESRESAEGPARGDAAGDWKDVGLRNPRGRRYFSDGLPGDRALLDIDSQGRRLMVIANYRASCIVDTDADASRPREDRQSRVLDRLDALDREAFVCRIELAPLGLAEAGNLIHRTLGGRSFSRKNVARIHEATGGNPLYMLEILRALHEQGAIPPLGDSQAEPNREIEVPQNLLDELLSPPPEPESPGADPPGGEAAAEVKDPAPAGSTAEDPGKRLICRRLESLDEVPQRVVRALAVLRRPVQVSLLESLLGYARTRIDEALAELQGRDFVKIQPVEKTPRFFLAHEDYVQCIYGELDSDERRDLHHRVGTILAGQERSGEPVRAYEIYEHLRQSSCPREALPFGLTSARYFANAYAEGLAAKIEKGLLGMLTSAEDLPLRLELLGELSRLETRIGELLIAKAHIKQLLEEGVDLDACTRLEAMLHLGDIYRRNGEPIKGIKTLHRAQKTCQEAVDGVRHARISGMLARMRLDRQDPKRAISLCMRGLKGLEGLGESEETETERAGLFEALAEAHLAKGEMVAAIHHYQGLLELVEEIRDDSRMATVLSVLGRVYYDRGNYFRAARYLFRALDVIRRTRDLRALSRAYDSLGKVYRNSGDHLRGLEYFNRSLRIRERIGDAEALSPTLNSLGSLYAHNGDYLQAIDYFKRSVQNSERFGSTAGIVRGFLHLGWVYFELGARKQVESLCKQILILSQEFHLIELEGEGHRLQGNLLLLRGDWKRAEREFRRAMEIASRRGRRKGEAAATLDLGALLYGKEEYEGALKLLSKGQVQAMEIQSIPLQVRAFLLKGNVYRFLKGGNSERAKECLRKGLDLISGARLLPLRWELEYSLAKVHQSNLEYLEAGESYRRAERILNQVADRLPEEMRVELHEDRRVKDYLDDYRRFKKEAAGRSGGALLELREGPKEERGARAATRMREASAGRGQDLDRLVGAARKLGDAPSPRAWAVAMLEEARRLVPAPGGFLAEVRQDRLIVLASSDMGPEGEWSSASALPGAAARKAVLAGEPISSGDAQWREYLERIPSGLTYKNRSLLVLPLPEGGGLRAALYLERPSARNPFTQEDCRLLEHLLAVTSGQLRGLMRLRSICRFEGTSILTAVGLEEELPSLIHRHREREMPLGFIEVMAPGLDLLVKSHRGEELVQRIRHAGGEGLGPLARVAADTYVFSYLGSSAERIEAKQAQLREHLEELQRTQGLPEQGRIRARVITIDPDSVSEEHLLRELRIGLFRPGGEFRIEAEIDGLARGPLTLKEAKAVLEKRYITAELFKSRGNITRAAESLGVHRPQLSTLIKKHKVRREDFE